jgi:hypothetical protein
MRRRDISDREVVRACRDAPAARSLSSDILQKRFPLAPDKVIAAAMERACRRGLIEEGVSIASSRTTPAGLALLCEEQTPKP